VAGTEICPALPRETVYGVGGIVKVGGGDEV